MKDFSDGPLSPDAAEQGERPRGGFWSKLARFWSPEEAPAAEPEPLSDEAAPGESSAQAVSGEAEIPDEVLEVTPALVVEQPAPVEEQPVEEQPEAAAQGPPSPDCAQPTTDPAADPTADLAAGLAEENATLRAAVDKQQEELARLSRELEHARQADAQVLEEIRAELERERKREPEIIQAAKQKFSAEVQEALAHNRQLHAEAEKLRADLTRTDSELQRVNAGRERLQSESDALRKESAGARQASQEVRRLRQELTQARAMAASGPARGSRTPAELTSELARRDEELRRLNKRIAGLEQELAPRGPLVPLSSLHPALQQVLANMGTAVEAQRIVAELWDRLLEQETRYNATREDTHRHGLEMGMLREQMAELCQDLITPITVLSASADLLVMRQDIPQDALASLEEIRQSTSTVRQVIARMQKMPSPGRHKA